MNDKFDYCALKIAEYYNQSIEGEGGNIHAAVEELRRFLVKNINVNDLEKFYQEIISTCQFFPRKVNLDEAYNRFMPESKIVNRIGPDAQLTMNNAAQAFAEQHNCTYLPPAGTEGVTIETLYAESQKMNDTQLLKKYGVKKVQELWTWMSDKGLLDEWYDDLIAKRRSELYKVYNYRNPESYYDSK